MKKTWKMRLVLLGTLLFLVGCGNGNANNTEGNTENNSETKPPYEKFTVVFDKNTTPDDLTDDESFTYYTTGWGAQQKSSIVEVEYAEDAVIPSADVPKPTRKGYYFAGWQTVPVVEETDIINGVSKYQVFFGNKLSEVGEAKVNSADKEELELRKLYNEGMYIKDFDTLTEDGTLTLYARWVEAKEVYTEEDLRAMKNDLYGAYILMNDITLTEEWEPIGTYYSNYEYFSDSWWTYAFRGNLDGNGHTIYGLKVNGAKIDNLVDPEDSATIWHDDGNDANGAAGFFGAICYGSVKNLTFDGAQINVAGDNAYSGNYVYAATVACFDMATSFKEVHIKNSTVQVEYDDNDMTFRDRMFIAVGGMEAGSWSGTVSNCSVENTTVAVNTKHINSHGGEFYVGGMIGENYATIKNSTIDVDVKLDDKDNAAVAKDTELIVNIGGLGAANTSTSGCTVNADLDLTISKPVGEALVNVGGFAGSQRYMTAEKNTITGTIKTNFTLDETKGVANIGSVLGRIDAYYASVILMYADGVVCGAKENTANVTLNGVALTEQMPQTGYPSINGEFITYIAAKDFTDADGNFYAANVDAVVKKYGSYVPKEGMINNIMYIKVE